MHWSKFTLYGTAELEQQLQQLMCDVASVVKRIANPKQYRALVLIGGYGRGEGGVERVGDEARPHNNLDFLLITKGLSRGGQEQLRGDVDEALEPLRDASGVGIDFSTISLTKLRRSPSLVMWYDMRFGHRTVLGDAEFVPSLKQFSLDKIPGWDVRNLLVNRGTLLVINDLMNDLAVPADASARTMVKHIMKAIIGYGDALLFFLGRYHWSYAEKQRRMRAAREVSEGFRDLYEEAISFRFRPDYADYLGRDAKQWMDRLRPELAEVHMRCEEMRLGRYNLDWPQYLAAALRESLWCDWHRPRAAAKKMLNLVRGPRSRYPGSGVATLGARTAGIQGVLPLLFPIVAYELDQPNLREFVAATLGAADTSFPELRRCYLNHWGLHGDDNFAMFLAKHGVSLHGDVAAATAQADDALGHDSSASDSTASDSTASPQEATS